MRATSLSAVPSAPIDTRSWLTKVTVGKNPEHAAAPDAARRRAAGPGADDYSSGGRVEP
ncbi:hypothetical protein [Reyranella soli]|uniref:hypothetical protein n=1 Tax=Reyranella soli TaxID=1230389 RepID=UPI001478E3DE|nr:hypothetical protein [Reyranella soli]